MEGAGGGRNTKKNSCKGKLREKIHGQLVAQEKSSCIRKKYSRKGNVYEKKFVQLENSHA